MVRSRGPGLRLNQPKRTSPRGKRSSKQSGDPYLTEACVLTEQEHVGVTERMHVKAVCLRLVREGEREKLHSAQLAVRSIKASHTRTHT